MCPGGIRVSKSAFSFCVDALLAVEFVTVLGTTAVVRFVFPPAPEAIGWTLWGREIGGWQDVQTSGTTHVI